MQIDSAADHEMLTAGRRAARHSPWLPVLAAVLKLAQGQAELIRHGERAWASVTFSGTRHEIVLAFTGAAAAAQGELFMDIFPEHEFTIARQLVAEAAVVAVNHSLDPEPRLEVTVELLLLDEA